MATRPVIAGSEATKQSSCGVRPGLSTGLLRSARNDGGAQARYPFFFPFAGSGRITLASAIAATLRPISSPASFEKR